LYTLYIEPGKMYRYRKIVHSFGDT
jgi:hypothetical protein